MTPAELRERVRLELAYSTTAQSLIRIDAAIRVVVEACGAEVAAIGKDIICPEEAVAAMKALLPKAADKEPKR